MKLLPQGDAKSFFSKKTGKKKTLSVGQLLAIKAAIDNKADAHVGTFQARPGQAFDQVFEEPVLSLKSEQESRVLDPQNFRSTMISLDEIVNKGGVEHLIGAREVGKSTLLLRIAKMAMGSGSRELRIPILVDFAKFKEYDNIDRIVRKAISGYECAIEIQSNTLINGHKCIFLVDNISVIENKKIEAFCGLLNSDMGSKHDWILVSDVLEGMLDDDFTKYVKRARAPKYIHNMTITSAKKLISRISPESIITHDVVLRLIHDNNLPRSPYMISIIAFLFVNGSVNFVINEANLVDKIIDIILRKNDDFNIVRRSADFGGLNIILEEAAAWLNEGEGGLEENVFIAKLSTYLSGRGILTGANEFYMTFLKSGIIVRSGSEVGFKYRAFDSFFLAKYMIRNGVLYSRVYSRRGMIRYTKEFSFVCDIVRQDKEILSRLEEFICLNKPDLFRSIDRESFLRLGNNTKLLYKDAAGDEPKSAIEQDDAKDITYRANSHIRTEVEAIISECGREGSPVPETMLQILAFFQGFSVWGRAISSLDYVELAIRKPSLVALLNTWAETSSLFAEAATQGMDRLKREMAEAGKALSEEQSDMLSSLLLTALPLNLLNSTFSHVGGEAVSQLLTDTFAECDLGSTEALGIACLLASQRPLRWAYHVGKYVDYMSSNDVQYRHIKLRCVFYTVHREFLWKQMSAEHVKECKEIIGRIIPMMLGASTNKGAVNKAIQKIEQRRALFIREYGE